MPHASARATTPVPSRGAAPGIPMPLAVRSAARRSRAGRSTVLRCVLALASLALGHAAQAQTFVVNNQHPAASDSGPGSETQPYRTIQAAITARKGPGITILVHPGSYPEQISIPASGAPGNPYVLRASGPGVVLEGSEDLSGGGVWEEMDDEVYFTGAVNWSPKQVFVDGVRLSLSTAAPAELPESSFVYVSGAGLYVNLGGADPGAHEMRVSKRNNGFTLSSRSFVTLQGFEVLRSNDRGINLHSCADVVIAENTVRFTSGTGIHANNCQRLTVERNRSSDSGMHGIALTAGTNTSTIRDNECARNVHPTVRLGNGIYLFGAPGNVLERNDLDHNQDSGVHFGAGADTCRSTNNRSWANGDHGFDHLQAAGTLHVHDLAYGNYKDGFSFEGVSPNSKLYNSLSVDNGLTQNRYDLWIEAPALPGFESDHNLFWNSNSQPIIRVGSTVHATLATHQASGLDAHSIQAAPAFVAPVSGDFTLAPGSPAIDAAHSGVTHWPATDALGRVRVDDPQVANSGAGPVPFADLGPFERLVVDSAPLVASPSLARASWGGTVSFTVAASDPDGDPILGLVMVPVRMPPGHGATFTPDPDNRGGTFTWVAGQVPAGNYLVEFLATNAMSGSSRTPIELLPPIERPEAPHTDEPPGETSAPVDEVPATQAGPLVFAHLVAAAVELEWVIHDLQGRLVWSESRRVAAGPLRLRWDGLDRNGVPAARGVYFARIRLGDASFVRRIVRF